VVTYQRGDVVWVNLDPTIGTEIRKKRPAIIVSNNAANRRYHQVNLIPLTSQQLDHIEPFQAVVPRDQSGLNKDSKALAEQIRTVSKLRLGKLAGHVSESVLERVREALMLHLGLG